MPYPSIVKYHHGSTFRSWSQSYAPQNNAAGLRMPLGRGPPQASNLVLQADQIIKQNPQVSAGEVRTIRELLLSPSRDPFQGDYARIMQRFAAVARGGEPIVDATVLYHQVTTALQNTLQAYLLCAVTQRGPRIYCIHSPTVYQPAFDETITLWDDQVFAFLGEPIQGISTLLQFPPNAFNVVNPWTKTAPEFMAYQEEFNEYGVMPVVQDHDNTVTLTFTRLLMYIPGKYAALLLSSRGFTPRQVWDRLHPSLVARPRPAGASSKCNRNNISCC